MRSCSFVVGFGLVLITLPAKTFAATAVQSGSESPQAAVTPLAEASTTGSFSPGAGTVIVADLSRPLEAKKIRVGDPVECSVTQDLLYQGKIIIPRGARVIGRVTDLNLSSKEHQQSRLGLTFEKIILKDKRELLFQFPAVIAALGAPIKRGAVPTTRPDQMPIQMQKGRTTGGALMDALDANASLAGANMPSTTGAIGATNRGVIGIKGLKLESAGKKGAAIVSAKGDVQLAAQTQLVLRVIAPGNDK